MVIVFVHTLNCVYNTVPQVEVSKPSLYSLNNTVNILCRYFSYEHFYVVYCKFWELDSDHDFLIDNKDLLRYGNHALTYRIVERIFSQVNFNT